MKAELVLVFVVAGLVLLLVVWPTERSARNLLRAWRVADPTHDQIAEAWSYLRKRRFWYPWIFLAAAIVGYRLQDGLHQYVVPIMGGLLIAELLALRPKRDRLRSATLAPRRVFDLVPRWAVACYALLVLTTVGYAVAGIVAQSWATGMAGALFAEGPEDVRAPTLSDGSLPWIALIGTALCLAVVGVVVWAALVRPSGVDVVVDTALRTRSSRVAIGLGIGLQGTLLAAAARRIDELTGIGLSDAPEWLLGLHRGTSWVVLVGVVGSVLAWVWVANPPLKRPYFARSGE